MSDTDWWFLDLALLVAATGAVALGLFSGISGAIRVLLAIPLVLLFPGYALVAALFPGDASGEQHSFDEEQTGFDKSALLSGGIKPTERFILSIAFSVALVPGIALITTVTPWGVTAEPVLFGISLLTICLALIGVLSRYQLSPAHRFEPTRVIVPPIIRQDQSTPYNRTNTRPYNIAIAFGLILLIASAGFAVANPVQPDGFTEFSVETSDLDGETETMYESTFTAGEPQEVPISITNQENGDRTYTVVALIQQVEYGDGDEVTVESEAELTNETVSVSEGETHEQPLEITPSADGEQHRLVLLLYEGDSPSDPAVDTADQSLPLPIELE
ncbi:DUF1616 domain-containing protein [Halostagnicola sp. A-GB9-2]|uniref:DUF1616 domain-containing protein n=1 Tax=Halostagnicola sp. A-GB9-2 TaxID=3048066 RepID=UPI0024C01E11|nr:DUF1616 domain-containing protein [Halostagnicola sp. A-GB9-2]MDJ1431843.1 DUF1616 domain-containing protein [Halostagnicola sp. A-GB9-2]